MVSLVSVLAQDLHLVKNKINASQTYVDPNILQYQSQLIGGENNSRLISVSDGEDSEDEDEEEDEEDEEDDDDDDNEDDDDNDDNDDDDDDDDDIDEDEDNTKEHIKLLNLTLANDDVEHNLQIEELNTEDIDTNVSSDIKTIHIENENENESKIEDTEYQTETKETDNNLQIEELSFLKNVSITDLGDIQDLLETKPEYKKMSLNRLREVVVNKGIIADASKLKKNDILKLLGDE